MAGKTQPRGVGFQLQSYYDEFRDVPLPEGHRNAVALVGLAASEIGRLQAEMAHAIKCITFGCERCLNLRAEVEK